MNSLHIFLMLDAAIEDPEVIKKIDGRIRILKNTINVISQTMNSLDIKEKPMLDFIISAKQIIDKMTSADLNQVLILAKELHKLVNETIMAPGDPSLEGEITDCGNIAEWLEEYITGIISGKYGHTVEKDPLDQSIFSEPLIEEDMNEAE